MNGSQSRLSRRSFLLSAGAGGAAAAAALVTRQDIERRPDKKEIADSKGYRVTEHIRNYYRTAKV